MNLYYTMSQIIIVHFIYLFFSLVAVYVFFLIYIYFFLFLLVFFFRLKWHKKSTPLSSKIINNIKYDPNQKGNVELVIYKDPESNSNRIFLITIGQIPAGQQLFWTKESYYLHQYLQSKQRMHTIKPKQI